MSTTYPYGAIPERNAQPTQPRPGNPGKPPHRGGPYEPMPGYPTPPTRPGRSAPPYEPMPGFPSIPGGKGGGWGNPGIQIPGSATPGAATPATAVNVAPVAPLQAAAASDPRAEALQMLLSRAAQYGDRGDSTKTITDLLNGVDMGRAGRTQQMWDTRLTGLQTTGDTYVTQMGAALKALRDKAAAGSGRRSGGGGGGGAVGGLTAADYAWLDQYLAGLHAPTAPTSHSGAGAGRSVGVYRPFAPTAPAGRSTPWNTGAPSITPRSGSSLVRRT